MVNRTSITIIGTLYSDTVWKEEALSRLEIFFDDKRNPVPDEDWDKLESALKYDKKYKLTISVEEIPRASF